MSSRSCIGLARQLFGMTEPLLFELDDIKLVGEARGPNSGLPLLFLHGGGQTRRSWRTAATEAARRGYRAVTIDLRGHGESGWSGDGRYGFRRFASDTATIAARLGQPVIVGASIGGIAGLLAAAQRESPIRGLVLVDVSIRLERAGTDEIAGFMQSAPDGFATLEEAADAVANYLPHRRRPADASGLLANLRKGKDGRLHWHWDPAFIRSGDPDAFDERMLDAAAVALQVPTLLIRGALSRVVSPAGAEALQRLTPHARVVNVQGADHMVAGDTNDAFNAALFSFLEAHFPSTFMP